MMRIDAHQHYWKISRNDYGWITPELDQLYRDYLPEDLESHIRAQGISKTVVVQAAPTLAETDYLLELSEVTDSIAGVVGWLDLQDPACIEQFERFAAHPKYVGFRVMIQEMADSSGVLQPNFVEALSYFAKRDVPVDLLMRSPQLPAVVDLLEAVPNLRGVIDHLGKPPIASGDLEPWRSYLTEIASHPTIYCKLSGMVTEADPSDWRPEQLKPYVHTVYGLFGPSRVMYGSDWPVCLLAATYDRVVDALRQVLPAGLTEAQTEALFGDNAQRFYKLRV